MKRLLLCVWLFAGFVGVFTAPVAAQVIDALAGIEDTSIPVPDYAAWEKTAARADEAIASARASTPALETLRGQLADARTGFQAAQDINAARIRTLRQQISALGPEPAKGETEPAELAARRKDLNAQLAEAQAPGMRAQEAYRQADGLIKELDRIVRERQANALLERGPSPLNPVNWSAAWNDLSGATLSIVSEVNQALQNRFQQAVDRLPFILLYVAVGVVLLLRARFWIEQIIARMRAKPKLSTGVTVFLLSLGQVIVPVFGLYLLTRAAYAAGIVGVRGEALLALLPWAGLTIYSGRWLGAMVLPPDQPSRFFSFTADKAREGRVLAVLLGWVFGVGLFVRTMIEFEGFPLNSAVVVSFPLIVITALLLFRMGQLMVLHTRREKKPDEDGYSDTVVGLLGRITIVFAVAGPVLASLGYVNAAVAVTFPTALTLALLALLGLLQNLVIDIYAIVVRGEDRARDALIPVLIGFAIMLAGLPVLALIWGARVADLLELWTKFREGFTFGNNRISPTDFLWFIAVFAIGYAATRLVQGTVRTTVLPKTRIDVGGRNAIIAGLGYLGIFASAVIAVTSAGIDLSSLAIVAGALSVGIGFGLQTIVSNFVSGIILLIERPVSEGDWIEVGGVTGFVRDISVRSTRIETFDRTDVIVPNADLISGMVTNWTHGNLIGRVIVPVGVAYGSDTRRVSAVLEEIAMEHPMVLANPKPGVIFQGFGADSMDFEIRAILRDVNYVLAVKSEINHQIAARFAEEGIEIPFAQRDVWLRNPEVLRAPPSPQADQAPPASEAGDSDSDGDGEDATPTPKQNEAPA